MKYKVASRILNNWAGLDPLRNEACFHAFQIRNILQTEFKTHIDQEEKIQKERQEIYKNIQQDIQELKEAGAKSVKDTEVEQRPGGGVNMKNIPPDITAQYRDKVNEVEEDLKNIYEKKKDVDFEPLTYDELAEYNLVKGDIIRVFEEIIDLNSEPEYDQAEEIDENFEEEKEVEMSRNGEQKELKESKEA